MQLWSLPLDALHAEGASAPALQLRCPLCTGKGTSNDVYMYTISLFPYIYTCSSGLSPARCPPCEGRYCRCSATTSHTAHR